MSQLNWKFLSIIEPKTKDPKTKERVKLSDLVPNNNKMSYNLISKEAMKFIEDSRKKIVEKDRREEANQKIEKEALKEAHIKERKAKQRKK